ncbi:MAG: class I SAM-dependent methyltransferase [Rhodospirillaceae bacterium]|jgi:hypothetical protein|nr:class I SAM-dependent methyltransferase [Rhodospirillaceae bacterium]MBT4220212.1 class I SAM-dependent methyltransferase [Rhodospirillaceae bacterium]MBT4464530.1 class I SAM-dependent methyltransferase [Rhodospirillaceae bacterium]MBT5013260.1 class I SAM-dependent methyltransferase [Rhodospirillaceae bacterium]MBT5309215.1 class I SAM-dependent methyltransferase [Rhodospirillaceae bacterium]
MLYVDVTREDLLKLLEKNGRVAEVGTFRGAFAENILELVVPDELHLIDPWVHQHQPEYAPDGSNVSDEQHLDNFEHVSATFADAINDGQVTLHRKKSTDAVDDFEDGYFDWVYIDGDHTHDAVASDLALFAPKVAPGGMILGHDYNNSERYGVELNFGVVEAVNEFVLENDWEFICLNTDNAATYALARKPLSSHGEMLALKLLRNIGRVFEVRDFPKHGFNVREIEFPDGVTRQFASF